MPENLIERYLADMGAVRGFCLPGGWRIDSLPP